MPSDGMPDNFDDPTLGEVYRRLIHLEATTQGSFRALDDRLAGTLVARSEYIARHEALVARVADLESADAQRGQRQWALATGVVVALIGQGATIIALVANLH